MLSWIPVEYEPEELRQPQKLNHIPVEYDPEKMRTATKA
jgi:hypothetical protein